MTHSPTITKLSDPLAADVAAFVESVLSPLSTEQRRRALTAVKTLLGIERTRKPRKPTLVSVAKQASKAAIEVVCYEVRPDGTVVVVTGKPEPVEPGNPWPLDEFRTKEAKQ